MPACCTIRARIVAARRQAVIHTERKAQLDYFLLGEVYQRRLNANSLILRRSLHSRSRCKLGHALEGLDELGPAVGVPTVIESIDADVYAARSDDLGEGQREREKDRVARGHVGDGNAVD